MLPIRLVVPGNAVGKGRPIFSSVSRSVRTPEKTRNQESFIRYLAAQEMQGKPPIDGPVELIIQVFISVPASWPKNMKESALKGELLPCTRPDLDNIVKLISDALNGIVFHDDRQIVCLTACKKYSEAPKTIVIIDEAHLYD